MTAYEKVTLKLKMVELAQNQSMIALTAELVGTEDAKVVSNEALCILNLATAYAENLLNSNE